MITKKRIIIFLFILGLSLISWCYFYQRSKRKIINGEKYLVIVIPSYNNKEWYERNLGSVFAQQYSNYHVIYIDDCSPDGTAQLVNAFIKNQNQTNRCTLIKNESRKGTLYNLYHAIHQCDDQDIIIDLDGDDWLNDTDVFQTINRAYDDANVWLTYGQYKTYPGGHLGICKPIPQVVKRNNSYRKSQWCTSHLRTFYAGFFKRIKEETFKVNGQFFPTTSDLAFMFPILEMVGGHIKFINKIMYIYNEATPLNDYKQRFQLQSFCQHIIRTQPSYEPLDSKIAQTFMQT